ncbi:TolC family protein [Arenicella sp. 4NH20-0111]|uniref:TolC family protein n=1 Tax=Arenicella sp. 4NH20-0111 TaxID=3127648 RepID=UPI00333E4FA1
MTTPISLSSAHWVLCSIFGVSSKVTSHILIQCNLCRLTRVCQFSKSLLKVSVLFSILVFSPPSQAQSFEDLEELLLTHPQLQSKSYQAESHKERSDAAMGLPDPTVSLGVNNFPIFDPSFSEFLPTNKAIGFTQRFPNRASRKARSESELAKANQSDEMREQLYAAMRAELIALLHESNRIDKQTMLAMQRDAKYDQLIEVVESEVGGGRSPVFRLAEIEAERAEVARVLLDLEAQKIQVNSRLIYLVGSVPETSPPVQRVEIWSGDAMDFYASRVADATLKISDSAIDEAKSAWKPEWSTQLVYQQREAGSNFAGDDWVSAMVTVTVPFWAKRKQAPNLRAAEANKAAAKEALSNARRQASAQYAYSNATLAAANKARAVLEQKIDAISNEILAQRANYESGAGDYAPIIDGEIAILKLRAEIAAEEARGAVAAAQMNALLVTP